jgi:phosphate transport system substrate-binding protein
MYKRIVHIILATCTGALAAWQLFGCESAPNSTSQTGANDPRSLTAMISVDGSTTMISLIQAWTQAFKKQNPEVPISVTSDDSGGGIASLINRTTDLAASSRELTPEETKLAHSKGIRLKRYTVARDAVACIVNPKNKVPGLTLEQLEKIYTGEINDWQEVGGPKSLPIVRLTREQASGTHTFFQEHVLHGKDCCKTAQIASSADQVIEKVEKEPAAIGYVGLGHALQAHDKVEIVPLKLVATSEATTPSSTSSIGDYPLSRPLLLFSDEQPKESVRRFVDFCLSDQGQRLVPETGYIGVHAK